MEVFGVIEMLYALTVIVMLVVQLCSLLKFIEKGEISQYIN